MSKPTKAASPAKERTDTDGKAATTHVEEKEVGKKDPSDTEKDSSEPTFDFGGLPARDLKKNLGCG